MFWFFLRPWMFTPATPDPAPYRSDSLTGFCLETDQPLWFTVDGASCRGFKGDTVLSALMASGRYGVQKPAFMRRQKGPTRLAQDEKAGWVHIVGKGLCVASETLLESGMVVTALKPSKETTTAEDEEPQPALPSSTRISAGSETPPLPVSETPFCLAVIGAGPMGLSACLAAADQLETGGHPGTIALIDRLPLAGGHCLARPQSAAQDWLATQTAQLDRHSAAGRVVFLKNCTALHSQGPHSLILRDQTQTLHALTADHMLFATGEEAQPYAIEGHCAGLFDLEMVLEMASHYGVMLAPGLETVVLVDHDAAYEDLAALKAFGYQITAILDPRPLEHPTSEAAQACLAQLCQEGTHYYPGKTAYSLEKRAGGTLGRVILGRPRDASSGSKEIQPCLDSLSADLLCFCLEKRPRPPVEGPAEGVEALASSHQISLSQASLDRLQSFGAEAARVSLGQMPLAETLTKAETAQASQSQTQPARLNAFQRLGRWLKGRGD